MFSFKCPALQQMLRLNLNLIVQLSLFPQTLEETSLSGISMCDEIIQCKDAANQEEDK